MRKYENRMAECRTNRNLKQKDIAKYLGVKESIYSKWEKGVNDISLEKINDLANFYRVDLDYLLGLSVRPQKTINKDINYEIMRQRLRLLRKQMHLSQSILSDKTGFAQTTYSSFETGSRTPTAFKLYHLANFYQASYDYLVGRKDENRIITKRTRPRHKF